MSLDQLPAEIRHRLASYVDLPDLFSLVRSSFYYLIYNLPSRFECPDRGGILSICKHHGCPSMILALYESNNSIMYVSNSKPMLCGFRMENRRKSRLALVFWDVC